MKSRATREGQVSTAWAWSGWDPVAIEQLLDADAGPSAVGFALARVLAGRLLPSPESRFVFRLYRYLDVEGSYQFVGCWDERCLESEAGSEPDEVLLRSETRTSFDDPERSRFLEDEVFLPLETHDGVIGFGVLRVLSGHQPTAIPDEDLYFLGRVGGAALARLLESDRAVRMHRSFQVADRHLEAVFSLTSDAILVLDPEGTVRVANESCRTLLGRFPAELIGKSFVEGLEREYQSVLKGAMREALTTDSRVVRQISFDGRDGSANLEFVFLRLQSDLEALPIVLARIRPAEQDQRERVVPDHAAAEEAETIRRQLRSIRGFLGLLKDVLGPQVQDQEPLHQIEVHLESLQGLCDLHAVREQMRTGEVEWRDRPVRLGSLLDRALARVSSRLQFRGIEIEREIERTSTWVRIDVDKWAIALAVLIDQVTESPQVRRLTLRAFSAPEFGIEFETDGGEALPAVQVASSSTFQLVRRLVREQGGMLESVPGTPLVRVYLPRSAERKVQHGRVA